VNHCDIVSDNVTCSGNGLRNLLQCLVYLYTYITTSNAQVTCLPIFDFEKLLSSFYANINYNNKNKIIT